VMQYNAQGLLTDSILTVPTINGKLSETEHDTIKKKYNEAGYATEEARFDINDKPINHAAGYHRVATQYNVHGYWIDIAYFDKDGNPATGERGYSHGTCSFDRNNTLLEMKFMDVAGKIARTKVTVSEITPDSQAAKLGLKVGDRILSYDGQEIVNLSDFMRITSASSKKQRKMTVSRGKEDITITIEPGLLGIRADNTGPDNNPKDAQ